MPKLVNIYPEIEKLKITFLWENELREIKILESDYNNVSSFMNELSINYKIDNFCYILLMLKDENSSIQALERSNYNLHRKKLDSDRMEVAKFLKLYNKDRRLAINKVKFIVERENGYDSEKREHIFEREYSFDIQNPQIVHEILDILWKNYNTKTSQREDYKEILKKTSNAHKSSYRRHELAKMLLTYLSKIPNFGKNKQYITIGYFFFLSGIEPNLSEKDFSNALNAHTFYKSYQDFLRTKILTKYFSKE